MSVALVIQHAMRKRRIVLYCTIVCDQSGSAHFSTLSLRQHNFRRKGIERKICACSAVRPYEKYHILFYDKVVTLFVANLKFQVTHFYSAI
jgi:hypothetical protein